MDHAITIGDVALVAGIGLAVVAVIGVAFAIVVGPWLFWDGH